MFPENTDEIAAILSQFEWLSDEFPRGAVEAAVARREEITPHLLNALEETVQNAVELDSKGEHMAHFYAMYLLAQFREIRACLLIVRFASLPGDLLDSLCGDFITDSLARILASVSGGDLSGMKSLIENAAVDQWVRGAAISGLVTLLAVGQVDRDEIVTYFASLFRGKLEREWSNVWDSLVSASSDIYPAELIEDIENAFRDDLVDSNFMGIEDIRSDLAKGKEAMLAELAKNPHARLIDDTAKEMEAWACSEDIPPFDKIDLNDLRPDEPYVYGRDLDEPVPDNSILATPTTVRYATPKIGRNEPCPCGTGRKYKKCCGS